MSERYVIKSCDQYLECVVWGATLGLTCYHTDDRKLAIVLNACAAKDLKNLLALHQVPTDHTFNYRLVKLRKVCNPEDEIYGNWMRDCHSGAHHFDGFDAAIGIGKVGK